MGATVKALTAELSSEMSVYMRNLFGLMVPLPLVWRSGIGQLRTAAMHLHLLQALAGARAMYCFFSAMANLPLAEGMLDLCP